LGQRKINHHLLSTNRNFLLILFHFGQKSQSVRRKFQNGKFLFGAEVVCASIRFFSLILGAGFLAPLFHKPVAWRILDVFVTANMWRIALSLPRPEFQHFFCIKRPDLNSKSTPYFCGSYVRIDGVAKISTYCVAAFFLRDHQDLEEPPSGTLLKDFFAPVKGLISLQSKEIAQCIKL